LIEVKNLIKRYGNHEAVSDLSFTIESGQIYGFLGPNGAGKTTTMNIMTGCLAATSGDVKINGYDIFEQPMEAKKQIGYLPENPPLYMERTPREYLMFVAEAKGIPSDKIPAEVDSVMNATHICDVADRLNKQLSKGYRQRVGIAQALLGNPDIIILDEPTVGLDPSQIIEIRDLIKDLGKKHTVILSTHILQEVQAICDTILIISKGRLVACDTPENLEKLFTGAIRIELEVEASEPMAKQLADSMDFIDSYTLNTAGNNIQSLSLNSEKGSELEVCRNIFKACCCAGIPILKMIHEKANLEDVFIELTAGDSGSEGKEEPEG
jgi:ABC-2 type transport system ATP-binding protein